MAERLFTLPLRPMPLYYFDLCDGDGVAPDEEGTELSSIDEVQNEAAYALADLLRAEVRASNGYPHARYLTIDFATPTGRCCVLGSRSNSSACSKAVSVGSPNRRRLKVRPYIGGALTARYASSIVPFVQCVQN